MHDPKIIRSLSPDIDDEAKRVVMMSPRWQPEKYYGKLINSDLTLPLSFTIQDTIQTSKIVNISAEFPGGIDKFMDFLYKHIDYPVNANIENIQGRVYCKFTVEKDGSVTNVKVIKGLDKFIDHEVMRVIALSPKWKPATQDGMPVSVQFTVPVSFSLMTLPSSP